MALIYIRLPHYVASYLRNIDPTRQHGSDDPFVIEQGDPLFEILRTGIEFNRRNAINIDCFSQKQWEAMCKGKYLSFHEGVFMDMQRKYQDPLTLGEIYTLSGHEDRVKRYLDTMDLMPDSEYTDEYLPILLPRVIVRNGREQKVYSDWYLPYPSMMRNKLIERFKFGFIRFMSQDRLIANAEQLTGLNENRPMRSKMESIDRFMTLYDIRPGEREREQMKKMLQREENALLYAIDADINHARFAANIRSKPTERGVKPKRILCHDEGEIYPSINAFARHIGTTANHVSLCLRNHYRCKGFSIERVD